MTEPSKEALAFAEQHGNTVTCEVTLAILLDLFAAQRGAEAWLPIETAPKDGTRIVLTDGDVPVVGLWRAHDEQWIVDWDHKPYQDSPRETPATRWMPLPSNKAGAPQTGGGDAGERARDYMQQALEIIHASNEWSGTPPPVPYREHLQRGIVAALRSSHREGAETISDDMNAAHWHGYREGAEAMREAAANLAENLPSSYAAAVRIRALPIPE